MALPTLFGCFGVKFLELRIEVGPAVSPCFIFAFQLRIIIEPANIRLDVLEPSMFHQRDETEGFAFFKIDFPWLGHLPIHGEREG